MFVGISRFAGVRTQLVGSKRRWRMANLELSDNGAVFTAVRDAASRP